MNYWKILGIKKTTDKKVVKRAYAKLLKLHKPEQDPEGYQRLREAYDLATDYCKTSKEGAYQNQRLNQNFNNNRELDNTEAKEYIKQKREKKEAEEQLNQRANQEKVEINETRKNELEKQYKQQAEKETQHQHFIELIKEGHRQVFSCEDTEEAINIFIDQLETDVLLQIKYRQIFENMCFQTGVNWSNQQVFPCELFDYMEQTFEWGDLEPKNSCFDENIGYLRGRINVGLEYLALIKLSQGNTFLSEQSLDISAARLLLGELRPRYFRWIAFVNRGTEQIKAVVEKFTLLYPIELCPEIDTESFRWWQRYFQDYRYSISHFVLGIILAVLFVFSLVLELDIVLEPAALFATLVISSILFSILGCYVLKLLKKGWQHLKQFYNGSWQNWIENYYVYGGITAFYSAAFLSKNFITSDLIYFWLFIFGSLGVISLLGSRIIFVLISTLTFVILEPISYIINHPTIFDNMAFFVGLASHFIWMLLARRYEFFIDKLNPGFMAISFWHITLSLTLGFTLLSGLKLIQLISF